MFNFCKKGAGYVKSKNWSKKAVLWIRIGFNIDLDSAFYLSADLDPDPESQTKVFLRIRILVRL
jgi:hypothetical protein